MPATNGDEQVAAADTPQSRLAAAKAASRAVARLTSDEKSAALHAIADALVAAEARIVEANGGDLDRGEREGLSVALRDRLRLDSARVAGLAASLREIAALPDPVGQILRGHRMPNGVQLEQVRVPFGVVGAIYEARPNVTVDIAALALRSGNAAV
ncbi:MAG: glutamate-5-semialdehyde dehydrogenase, partial [Microbacterium sp.]